MKKIKQCSQCGVVTQRHYALHKLTGKVIGNDLVEIWRTDLCGKCDAKIADNNDKIRLLYPDKTWREK